MYCLEANGKMFVFTGAFSINRLHCKAIAKQGPNSKLTRTARSIE